MELKLNRGDWTYFIKFGGKDSCKLSQMAFDPYVFRKRQYIQVENWKLEVEQNYWKKEFQEIQGYPVKTFHDFLFTTSELRMTTLLQQKHVDGTVIDEALLRVFNQSEIPVLNIYFKKITINKIIREGKDGHHPLLTFLFDYERIKMEYLNTPTGKGPAAKTITAWNIKTDTGDFEDPVYEEDIIDTTSIPATAVAAIGASFAVKEVAETHQLKIMVVNDKNNVPIPNINFRIGLPDESFYKDVTTNKEGVIELNYVKKGKVELCNSKPGKTIKKSLHFVAISEELPADPTEDISYENEYWTDVLEVDAYKVQDNDSLKNLAEANQLSVNALTEFNWETTDPNAINENMRDLMGCTEKSVDGSAYILSETNSPGIIHIPKKLSLNFNSDKIQVIRVNIIEPIVRPEDDFEFSD